MAAAATDLLLEVGDPGTATTLSAPGYVAGDPSINIGSTSNWPTATGLVFAIDEAEVVNGQEVQVPGTYNEYVGVVDTATSIVDMQWVRGVGDRNYSAGALTRVYIPVSAERENRIVEWGMQQHKQSGAHKDVTADSLAVSGATTLAALSSTAPGVNMLRFTGEIAACALRAAPTGWLLCDGSAVSRSTYAALFAALVISKGTVTITIASPGVVTLNSHGFQTGDSIYLTTTGALPTGLSANTQYFVIRVDANTFRLATSLANADAGTAINTSGSQSGTHTLFDCPYGVGDGSTTFNVPDLRGRVLVGLDTSQTEFRALGKSGGEKTHVLTVAEMPAHTHTQNLGAPAANVANGTGPNVVGNTNNSTTGSTGSDQAHNNLQPYRASNYVIKT